MDLTQADIAAERAAEFPPELRLKVFDGYLHGTRKKFLQKMFQFFTKGLVRSDEEDKLNINLNVYDRKSLDYIGQMMKSKPGFKLDMFLDDESKPEKRVYLTCDKIRDGFEKGYAWRLWVSLRRMDWTSPYETGFVECRVVYDTNAKIWRVNIQEENLSEEKEQVFVDAAVYLDTHGHDVNMTTPRPSFMMFMCNVMKKLISFTITTARNEGVDTNASVNVEGSEITFRDCTIWRAPFTLQGRMVIGR